MSNSVDVLCLQDYYYINNSSGASYSECMENPGRTFSVHFFFHRFYQTIFGGSPTYHSSRFLVVLPTTPTHDSWWPTTHKPFFVFLPPTLNHNSWWPFHIPLLTTRGDPPSYPHIFMAILPPTTHDFWRPSHLPF